MRKPKRNKAKFRTPPPTMKRVICPDCGKVNVRCDVFDGSECIFGVCPKCRAELYFATPMVNAGAMRFS